MRQTYIDSKGKRISACFMCIHINDNVYHILLANNECERWVCKCTPIGEKSCIVLSQLNNPFPKAELSSRNYWTKEPTAKQLLENRRCHIALHCRRKNRSSAPFQ